MIDEALLMKLATLARIEVPAEDVPARLEDFRSILKCIDTINAVVIPEGFRAIETVTNHVRADIVRSASVDTVTAIQNSFPDNALGRLRVPQVMKQNLSK